MINLSIENALNSGVDKIVITGDLNENLLNPNKTKLADIILDNSLYQTITEPTYFCETSSSLLDPILTNDKELVLYSEVCLNILKANMRYHCPVSGIIEVKQSKKIIYSRRVWDYKHGHFNQFKSDLNNLNFDYILDNAVNDSASKLNDDIIEAAEKNSPYRMVKIRPQDPPWMTSHIKNLIRRRKRLHCKAKQSQNSGHLWHQSRQARN